VSTYRTISLRCHLTRADFPGDLIATIGVFKDVGLALRKSGGASTEFQEITSEHEDLAIILKDIETLDPSSTNPAQLDAIKSHAQLPLQTLNSFLHKIQKYNNSLGNGSSKGYHRGVLSKAKWATLVSDEVPKLRQKIDAQTTGLRLLLQHLDQ
jgi:hypothetical protein